LDENSAEAGVIAEIAAEAGKFSAEAGGLDINAGLSDMTLIVRVLSELLVPTSCLVSVHAGDLCCPTPYGVVDTIIRTSRSFISLNMYLHTGSLAEIVGVAMMVASRKAVDNIIYSNIIRGSLAI
jgi:hypothetical protein